MGEPVKIVDLAKRMISLSGSRDVKIEFTGLRHGEKLYEELLKDSESTIETYHDKIMIAKVVEYDFEVVKNKVDELINASYEHDDFEIVKKMKEIVPEFNEINSSYATGDYLMQN